MSEGKKGWKWWQKAGLGLALGLLILVVAFMGFRRTWIRPLPGVRMTIDTPVLREAELPPESSYFLLGKALNVAPIGMQGFRGTDNEWSNARVKLRNQPWPAGADRGPETPELAPTATGEKLEVGSPGAPWTQEQCQSLLRCLGLHRDTLALLDEALAAPLPPVLTPADGPHSVSPDVFGELMVAHCLAVSAEYHRARGDFEDCFWDLRRIWGMNAIVARHCSLLDLHVVGLSNQLAAESAWYASTRHDVKAAILKEAAASALRAADSSPSAADQLRIWGEHMTERLGKRYDDGALLQSLIYMEFLRSPGSPKAAEAMAGTARPLALLAGSTRTAMMRHLSDFGQQTVAIAEAPFSAKTGPAYEALAPRPTSKREALGILLSVRDPMGYLLAAYQAQTYTKFHSQYAANQARLRGIALFLAIKAYEKDNGHVPDALDQLVPDYLPRVPKDPYGGGPFRYLKSGVPGLPPKAWAVYSIGSDFTDSGGAATTRCPGDGYKALGTPDAVWSSVPDPVRPAAPRQTPASADLTPSD